MAVVSDVMDVRAPVQLERMLLLVAMWVGMRQVSGATTYATCYASQYGQLVSSHCTYIAQTHCCYHSCCDNFKYRYGVYASVCSYSMTLSTDTCTDYRATQCCAKATGYYTEAFTCCPSRPSVTTYGECRGPHSTAYCTNAFRTSCCYSKCCNSYQQGNTLSKCGRNTCWNYKSTHCCGNYNPTCCDSKTYTTCTGGYFYTATCTDKSSTLCCYDRCCNSEDMKTKMKKCGPTTCFEYSSTFCCVPGNRCCNRRQWYQSSTIYTSRDVSSDFDATGSIVTIVGVVVGVVIVTLIIFIAICAMRSAGKLGGSRGRRTPYGAGPVVAGAQPGNPSGPGVPSNLVPMLPQAQAPPPAPAAQPSAPYGPGPNIAGAPPSYDAAMHMEQGVKMSDLREPSAPYVT